MGILARNSEYLVEHEDGLFTISRYSDGYCKGVHRQRGIVGWFKADVAKYGADRAIETYLRMFKRLDWEPMYKPQRMPGADHPEARALEAALAA